MKNYYLIFLGLLIFACGAKKNTENTTSAMDNSLSVKTIYDFKATTIEGVEFDFGTLRGKKIMLVNTASKCGLTPQYEQLETLFKLYKDSNFVVIGFPANNFLKQEPGTNEEIVEFCQKNYGVSFQMMEKISVKGSEQHAIYKYLTSKSLNGFSDNEVKWNFQKYLIGEEGKLEKIIEPSTSPLDESIISWIRS